MGACEMEKIPVNSRSELAADGHAYTNAKTLKKPDISTEELVLKYCTTALLSS